MSLPLRILAIAAFLVGCFFGGILLVNLVMNLVVGRGDEVTTPQLTGLDLGEARRQASVEGLGVELEGNKYTDEQPPNTVLRQTPEAGRKVKRGRSIRVVVSLGAELREVPPLRGMPLADARLALERQRLSLGDVARGHADGIPTETVATSQPPAGEMVPRGSPVALLVSTGQPRAAYLMPDLTGRQEEEARLWLTRLGLAAEVRTVSGKPHSRGIVTDQNPAPGSRVETGDAVELIVAR